MVVTPTPLSQAFTINTLIRQGVLCFNQEHMTSRSKWNLLRLLVVHILVPLLSPGSFCDIRLPPKVITSSSNSLRIWFYSDKSEAYQGFNASYTSQWEKGEWMGL